MRKDILGMVVCFGAGVGIGAAIATAVHKRLSDSDTIDDWIQDEFYISEDDFDTDLPIVVNNAEKAAEGYYNYTMNKKPSMEELINRFSKAGYSSENAVPATVEESSEDKFFEENGYEKRTATYFTEDEILAGWNDELEEIDASELDSLVLSTILEKANLKESMYFRNEAEKLDICIMVSDGSYDDAYEELIAREVEEANKEE